MTNTLNEFLKIMYAYCGTSFVPKETTIFAWREFCSTTGQHDIIDMWDSFIVININLGNIDVIDNEIRLTDKWVSDNIGVNIIGEGENYDK